MGEWIPLLRETWSAYQKHNGTWLAAALAYFGAFAVAPLIIVLVEISGFFLHNHQHVLDVIFSYMQRDLGSGSDAVRAIVTSTFNEPRRSLASQVVGWALFVLAAIGLFSRYWAVQRFAVRIKQRLGCGGSEARHLGEPSAEAARVCDDARCGGAAACVGRRKRGRGHGF
jgi:uncharacterized BrkB/YihY/UPF0761 family membrane protein